MKICLIHPLWQQSFYDNEISCHWPPLGIAYIASLLEKHGHNVMILDRRSLIGNVKATSKTLPLLDKMTEGVLKKFSPDIVGITATTPLITDAYHSAGIVKEFNLNIPVIIGGCHPTAEPKKTLEECPQIDAVCIGEGEFTLLDFVNNKPWKDISGIAYRENGKVITTPKRDFYPDLDDLPFPARHLLDRNRYFCLDSYLVRGYLLRGTTMLAARGCPYKCSFCQSGQLASSGNGNYVRFHSPEYVVEQIKHLIKDFGIQGILFAEDVFSIRRENVYNICQLMVKEGINKKVKWSANVRVDRVDRELLRTMKSAGCIQVVYGCESGSQRTLDRLKKKTTVQKNYEAIKMTKEVGLDVEVNIMVGLPDESEQDLLETINFLKKARPHRVNRSKLYLLPGTPFYEEFVNCGKIKNLRTWDDLWDIYFATDFTFANIPSAKFLKLQAKMDREVTYPINFVYHIRNNLRTAPIVSFRYLLLLMFSLGVLSLPIRLQKVIKKIARFTRVRYIFVGD